MPTIPQQQQLRTGFLGAKEKRKSYFADDRWCYVQQCTAVPQRFSISGQLATANRGRCQGGRGLVRVPDIDVSAAHHPAECLRERWVSHEKGKCIRVVFLNSHLAWLKRMLIQYVRLWGRTCTTLLYSEYDNNQYSFGVQATSKTTFN